MIYLSHGETGLSIGLSHSAFLIVICGSGRLSTGFRIVASLNKALLHVLARHILYELCWSTNPSDTLDNHRPIGTVSRKSAAPLLVLLRVLLHPEEDIQLCFCGKLFLERRGIHMILHIILPIIIHIILHHHISSHIITYHRTSSHIIAHHQTSSYIMIHHVITIIIDLLWYVAWSISAGAFIYNTNMPNDLHTHSYTCMIYIVHMMNRPLR